MKCLTPKLAPAKRSDCTDFRQPDTCWIRPEANHNSSLAHLTHLGDLFDAKRENIIRVWAAGYLSRHKPAIIRFMQPSQHRRLALSKLFFLNPTLREPLDVDAPPFDTFGRYYKVCQRLPSS